MKEQFYQNFIYEQRYLWLLKGLKTTLILTLFALCLGVLIGGILALVRTEYDRTGRYGAGNAIAKVYVSVIRGTPAMIQLLIMNFVVFGSRNANLFLVGALAFGINSGAYVCEIMRAGIDAVPKGQWEAGACLGLKDGQIVRHIIAPQAVRTILPALVNEFISLLKETAIIGYIGLQDVTKAAMLIESRTFNAFWPLLAAALMYLSLVLLLTKMAKKIEKKVLCYGK